MTSWHSGTRNLITDVKGIKVGNSHDADLKSGVSVIVPDEPAVCAVEVLGGAPGTRETDLLAPHNSVEHVHALVLSGGSAFGLDSASGVQAALREQGIGFEVGPHKIPIVPAAIIFDLINGGDKDWGRFPPYRDLGYGAAQNLSHDFDIGTAGAGVGALTATCKGGLGSASTVMPDGTTLGALVVANPMGSPLMGDTSHFWAAPFELDNEFGGLGIGTHQPDDLNSLRIKFRAPETDAPSSPIQNTTIACIATDAVLTKAQAKRLAIAAHDGFSRAIWPSHTPMDGDLIFTLATGKTGITPDHNDFIDLCALAGATMARAIARGIYAATPQPNDLFQSWSQLRTR